MAEEVVIKSGLKLLNPVTGARGSVSTLTTFEGAGTCGVTWSPTRAISPEWNEMVLVYARCHEMDAEITEMRKKTKVA